MIRFDQILAVALLGLGSATASQAQPVRSGDITVDAVWSRATPPGARVGVGYLTIANSGAEPDRLLSVSSPRVPAVEIHSMSVADGMMDMQPVEEALEIPASGQLELAPGAYHLMLDGLETPLVEGERVPVTLVLEHAGPIEIELPVGSLGARGPSAATGNVEPSAEEQDGHEAHGSHGTHGR